MRILGWSNGHGGVHYYRIHERLRALKMLGHRVAFTPAITAEAFKQYDMVLVRGLHHPINSQVWRWAADQKDRALLVYDLDDDIWAWNPAYTAYHYWGDEERYNAELNMVMADLVTTTNDELANVLVDLNPRVAVIPNTVPAKLLSLLRLNHSQFIVGWQGGEQHATDLQLIYGPVFRFLLRHKDAEFHVWGGAQEYGDLPSGIVERVIVHPWQDSVWHYYRSLSMDVGLAPLNQAETFNQTKSDIRIREFAALGFPFIASNHRVYAEAAKAAQGRVAVTEEDWSEYLESLYHDGALRHQLSIAGRKAAKHWTTERTAREVELTYERASYAARNARTFRPVANSSTYRSVATIPVRSGRL